MDDHEKEVDEDILGDLVVGRRLVAVKPPARPFEQLVDRTLIGTAYYLVRTGSAEGLAVQETMVWRE